MNKPVRFSNIAIPSKFLKTDICSFINVSKDTRKSVRENVLYIWWNRIKYQHD